MGSKVPGFLSWMEGRATRGQNPQIYEEVNQMSG